MPPPLASQLGARRSLRGPGGPFGCRHVSSVVSLMDRMFGVYICIPRWLYLLLATRDELTHHAAAPLSLAWKDYECWNVRELHMFIIHICAHCVFNSGNTPPPLQSYFCFCFWWIRSFYVKKEKEDERCYKCAAEEYRYFYYLFFFNTPVAFLCIGVFMNLHYEEWYLSSAVTN